MKKNQKRSSGSSCGLGDNTKQQTKFYSSELHSWFSRLTPLERSQATISTDSFLLSIIPQALSQLQGKTSTTQHTKQHHQAFLFDWQDDTHEFLTSAFPNIKSLALEYSSQKRSFAENALISSVRLTWESGQGGANPPPVDTLFLHQNFLSSSSLFFQAMKLITWTGFLESPCRVDSRLENGKVVWKWKTPDWWINGRQYHTFGELIAMLIEKSLWIKWFEISGHDPRVPNCTRRFSFVTLLPILSQPRRKGIVSMWMRMTSKERKNALQNGLGQLLQAHLKDVHSNNFDQQKQMLTALTALLFHNEREQEEHERIPTIEGLEDVLFSSTLKTYGTIQDKILKFAATCLSTVYSERLLKDLGAPNTSTSLYLASSGKKRRRSTGQNLTSSSNSILNSPTPTSATSTSISSSKRESRKLHDKHSTESIESDFQSAPRTTSVSPETNENSASKSVPSTPNPERQEKQQELPQQQQLQLKQSQLINLCKKYFDLIFNRSWMEIEKRKKTKETENKKTTTTTTTKGNNKKKRRAGPTATALDLAADLVSNVQKRSNEQSMSNVPSDSLDLASSQQQQKQQNTNTTATAENINATNSSTPVIVCSTDALDLAREKQRRNARKTSGQQQQQQQQQKSKTRSHSNPRKSLSQSSPSSKSEHTRSPTPKSSESTARHLDLAISKRTNSSSSSTPTRPKTSHSSTPSTAPPLPATHPVSSIHKQSKTTTTTTTTTSRTHFSPLQHPHEMFPQPFGFQPKLPSSTAPPSPRVTAKPTYLDKLLSRPSYALDLATANNSTSNIQQDKNAGTIPPPSSYGSTDALDLAQQSQQPISISPQLQQQQTPSFSLAQSAAPGMKPTYISRLLNKTGQEITYYEVNSSPPKFVFPQPQTSVSNAPSVLHQRSSSEKLPNFASNVISISKPINQSVLTPSITTNSILETPPKRQEKPELRRNRSSPMLVPPTQSQTLHNINQLLPIIPHQPPEHIQQMPLQQPQQQITIDHSPTISPQSTVNTTINTTMSTPSGSPSCLSAKSDDSDIFESTMIVNGGASGVGGGVPFLDLAAPPMRERAHSGNSRNLVRPLPSWYPTNGRQNARTPIGFANNEQSTTSTSTITTTAGGNNLITPPISPSTSPIVEHYSPESASGSAGASSFSSLIRPISPKTSATTTSRSPRIKREKSPTHHPQDALDLADTLPPNNNLRTFSSSSSSLSLSMQLANQAAIQIVQTPTLPPWTETPYPANEGMSQRLTREIQDFALYVTQMFDDSRHLYESMIGKIITITHRVLPQAKVAAFGSYATGLCIPTSDLDLVCSIKDEMENLRKAFRTLARELRKEEWVAQIKPIETATVPIIKLMSRDECIPTDITFDCAIQENGIPQHRGLRSVELMRKYASETPKLRPLLLVLKQFLHERGLNNPYSGGLGSYCLVLMLKTFLQLFDQSGNVLDLGGSLTAFLRYYGTVFDYATTGISVRHGGVHFRIGEVGHFGGTGPLVIEDPFDPMTNIASGVFAMWRVRVAFESAFVSLTDQSKASNQTSPTLLSRILRFDDQ